MILSALRAKRAIANVDVLDAFGLEQRQVELELSRLVTIVHHDIYANAGSHKYGSRSVVHLRDHVARGIAPLLT